MFYIDFNINYELEFKNGDTTRSYARITMLSILVPKSFKEDFKNLLMKENSNIKNVKILSEHIEKFEKDDEEF